MNIYGLTRNDLEFFLENNGLKKSRAVLIIEQIYQNRTITFDKMDFLKAEEAQFLKQKLSFEKLRAVDVREDESVCKILFELSDKNKIETVIMKHNYGNAVCISTQIGCNMGCVFCESGRLKKVRNLEPHEMVLQLLCAEELSGLKISNVVLMGIGEPFDNYDNVIKFIDIITDQKGLDIGSRHITVSTSGIVPRLLEFIKRPYPNNIAISLHAPTDEIRDKIMPVNKKYNLSALMGAVNEYSKLIKKKITFEYIMIKGVNDSEENARQLAELLKGIHCYVNLIPYNETSHIGYKKSEKEQMDRFYAVLKGNGIRVTTRREFGSSVKAACGQLRAEHEENHALK